MHKIAAIGEILWDNFPDGKVLGGAPTNFAIMSKYLGNEAYVISAVGNDNLGTEIFEKLNSWGINTELLQINPDYKTGEVIVTIDETGQPRYRIVENRACDHIHFTEEMADYTDVFDAISFGSLSQRSGESKETIFKLLSSLPAGCLKVCDLNIRQNYYSEALIGELLNISDVFKINETEQELLEKILKINLHEVGPIRRFMSEWHLQALLLTQGAKQSEIVTLNNYSKMNSKKARVIDTVGAGDSFLAAFVEGYLKKLPLQEIHENAVTLSAEVCQVKGATGILTMKK